MSVVSAWPAMGASDRRWRDMGESKRCRFIESETVEGLDKCIRQWVFFAEVGQGNRRLGAGG